MVELDQFKYTLNGYTEPLKEVRDSLDLENKEKRVEELEREMEAPGFWDNAERSQKMMKELSALKGDMEIYHKLQNQKEEIELMIEMGYEENDPSIVPDIQEMLDEFIQDFEHIRIKTLLSGEYDKDNAIVTLHAGAGGTESCDWASMLYRMYLRWADRQGFSTEVLDYLDGDEAGIKSVTFQVNGENAYGYLKSEKGVHRLVEFHLLMQQESDKLLLFPVMLCRILKKTWMWKSIPMICELIPIVPVAQADSISIKLLLPSVSHIFQQELWYSVRMNVLSSRIKIKQCRC